MSEKNTTKERILLAALDLFSERGYDDTSIDLIGSAAGIKGPSIYSHYKGKEDILDNIISMMEEKYDATWGNMSNVGKIPDSVEELKALCMQKLEFTINDPQIKKTRIFCVKEQFRNEKLAALTTKHQLTGMCELYAYILDEMIKKGLIKKDDSSKLAQTLVLPICLFVSTIDREPKRHDEMWEKIVDWLDYFIKENSIN